MTEEHSIQAMELEVAETLIEIWGRIVMELPSEAQHHLEDGGNRRGS